MATEITQIDIQDFTSQTYEGNDISLLSQFEINTSLISNSYIEYFIYDNNKNLLATEYSFLEYTILNDDQSAGNNSQLSQIEIDPEKILINTGYDQGEYITYFNFLNKQIGSELQQLYIAEISSDRTEIRLDSTSLTEIDIVEQTNNFIQERENSTYFLDFYLNFGDNNLFISNNISLDNQDPTNPTVLIKLYEPLADEFDLNSTLWVVTVLEESIAYKVTFEDIPITFTDTIDISGPNFNLDVKDKINNSSLELSYADLILTSLTSSTNQINSLLEEKEIDINIDYTDFSNFTHFSAVKSRIENFVYKVSLIEQYSSSIALINSQILGSTSSSIDVINSKAVYESKIDSIITNFDGYDYYLYYSSESLAYPKLNSTPPYNLYSSTSPTVLTWLGSDNESSAYYGGILLSASIFDNSNPNNLFYSIPEYLREDPANDPYRLFVEMIGQHYDNIWIYYKDVTQKYNADNRLENGISKDIVADAIRDFGIKLYQNNFSNEDLYTAFLGLTPDGSLFPFPNITGSLPTPSGYEYIDTKISASNNFLPLDDVNKSLYKRIYHNLPYLLQTKGTIPGLRALITSYGIPDTVLRIKEYGGKDKINTNDWDYWQNEFNYAYKQDGNNYISTQFNLNPSWGANSDNPETIMFRFKTNGLPTSSIPYSQSLFTTSYPGPGKSHLTLRYTGSAYSTVFPPSSSYSGSIIDPYYQYAYLDFYPNYPSQPTLSASIYLPFFNGDWWSVMVKKSGSGFGFNTFELFSGNKMYEGGENGTSISFFNSSSVSAINSAWISAITLTFGISNPITINTNIYNNFSGSFQEIRYYAKPISESIFKDFIMNPSSIEGNLINSGYNELAFRLPLGGELYTGSKSIHPKVTGSWVTTSSFTSDSTASFNTTPIFVPNTEYFYYDQPIAGIKNAIADKIRIENNVIPEGNTLSPFMSLSQQANISQSYTANTNLLEVAFSPQDEINDNINSSLGYFNIGDYIGDPRLRSSSAESYPALDALRNSYFEKYTKNYNLVDFVRLIKFFDNSLFKMIKDFVPARTSLASGIVIKQHILERNKVPQPQVNTNSTIAHYSSGSVNNLPFTFQDISVSGTLSPQWNNFNEGTVENFNGGTAGVFEMFNGIDFAPSGSNIFNLTQSWSESVQTISGSVDIIHNSQDEFYNGEFEGSVLTITTQSLNVPLPNSVLSFDYTPVRYSPFFYSLVSTPTSQVSVASDNLIQDQFFSELTVPAQGEILLLSSYVVQKSSKFGGSSLLQNSQPYVKIHKFDKNGVNNDIALRQATRLRIKHTILPDCVTIGNILDTVEHPDYFLYKVQSLGSNTADNFIKDYSVSASTPPVSLLPPTGIKTLNFFASVIDPSGLWDNLIGSYTTSQTSNVALIVSASITTSGSIGGGAIFYISTPSQGIIASKNISTGANITTTLTSSYFPLGGDLLSFKIQTQGSNPLTLKSGSFLVTQSIPPTASMNNDVIIEPYITDPGFYNSDENALLNSVNEQRENTFALDVDYTYGIVPPINFNLLISGAGTPATVPDSNYTSKKSTILKYEGSKSTSQFLNKWTQGDIGTYGKLPSVESLKTMIAYCDGIGGWPPERENASAMNVLYLIKADGTVVIPNTSQDSLSIMQQTFQTGERVFINTKNIVQSPLDPYRTVIRGGSHIEPILYTQYGQLPNVTWNTTMSFEDIVLAPGGNVGNYVALYSKNYGDPPAYPPSTILAPFTLHQLSFSNIQYGNSFFSSNGYQVPELAVLDGVGLRFDAKVTYKFLTQTTYPENEFITSYLYIYKNGVPLLLDGYFLVNTFRTDELGLYEGGENPTKTVSLSFGLDIPLIPASDLQPNDIYTAYWKFEGYTNVVFAGDHYLKVSQYPISTQPVTSSNANSIWNWGNKTTYPYIITSSNPTLVQMYGNPNVKAKDISGSGFNTIQLPWKINYGDEFKFEGREDFTYMVKNIYAPAESGSGRIFQTGSIEVHFNTNLPVSASSTAFNLDHFLIRRYVDDAAQNIITGFKPPGSTGPYLIKPEFVVPELNKSIDEVILDLTQKGLIT